MWKRSVHRCSRKWTFKFSYAKFLTRVSRKKYRIPYPVPVVHYVWFLYILWMFCCWVRPGKILLWFFSCDAEYFLWTEFENLVHFLVSMDILHLDLIPELLERMNKKWHKNRRSQQNNLMHSTSFIIYIANVLSRCVPWSRVIVTHMIHSTCVTPHACT